MPDPVEFNVSLSPFPASGKFTPAELAQAIVDRLTITPAEPWSSFQVVNSLPTSDVGPVIYNRAWYIWDTGTSSYKPHVQDGSGLVNGTVTVAKLANFTNAGAVLISNGSKVPTELTAGTNGQVLSLAAGVPGWADSFVPAAGGNVFEYTLSAPQSVNIVGAAETVEFNGKRIDPVNAFDSANYRWPVVSAGQVWFFYAQAYLQKTGTAAVWDVQLDIRRDGAATGLGTFWAGAAAIVDQCVSASGIILMTTESYIDVGITVNGTTDTVDILANVTNTRFGGFRIL